MRIQCQHDVVAGAVYETARILFSYYFLSILSAPLLLSMTCAAVGLLFNGMRQIATKETMNFQAINYELAIYRGCDLLVFFLTINNVDPTSYMFVQVSWRRNISIIMIA